MTQCAARPQEPAIDGPVGDSQVLGDLAIAPPLAVFQQQDFRVAGRQRREGLPGQLQPLAPHERIPVRRDIKEAERQYSANDAISQPL